MPKMKINVDEKYWDKRAKSYNNLEWVKNPSYLKEVVNAVNPKKNDVVLDVGTGTGVLAKELASYVEKVIGIDNSQAMLDGTERISNVYYLKQDIRIPLFQDGIFSKVTARQVFHHIPRDDLSTVIDNCFGVLKEKGIMIIAEPVCPDEIIKNEYYEIFNLKDNRQIFTAVDLSDLLYRFRGVSISTFKIRDFSVKNWLDNNALPVEVQNKIFELHVTASKAFKKAYNMRIINGDCLIDTTNVIVTGEK